MPHDLSDTWLLFRVAGQPTAFSFKIDGGAAISAGKDVHVAGLCSTALGMPLPIALDTPFVLSSAAAADLEEAYLVLRYQIS